MTLLNALGEFSHRLFRVGRNIRAYRLRIDQEQVERRVEVVKKINNPNTPRFPVPCLPQRTLRTPPPSLMMSPASGFLAIKSTKASRSSSLQTSSACCKNERVSATVMGLVHIPIMYAIGAGRQGEMLAGHSPALPSARKTEKLPHCQQPGNST